VSSQGAVSGNPSDAFAIVNLTAVHYVPLVLKRVADTTTGIQVQNLSNSATTAYVIYYNRDGFADPSWIESRPLAPGGSATFFQGDHPTLPIGFDGSAVVQSTQASAAVVNRVHLPSAALPGPLPGSTFFLPTPIPVLAVPPTPLPLGGPQYGPYDDPPNVATAGAFQAIAAPTARQVAVPVVFGGFNGYRTTVSVQNTGELTTDYAVALYPTGSTTSVASFTLSIPPLAARRIRLAPDIGVPPDFVGTALITSTSSPVTGIAETVHSVSGLLFSYGGTSSGATTHQLPLLFRNAAGWVSGAQVVNVSTMDVLVNASLRGRGGLGGFTLPPRTLRPNESYTYYLPVLPEIPDGFIGSATFVASGPITVVAQHVQAERGNVMAYTGFSRATTTVGLPLLFKESNGWNSGVQVQNTGTAETNVTLTYFANDGLVLAENAIVGPGSSITFYQRDNPALPAGYVGSGVLSSSGGQPIVAVVNQVNYLRLGDNAMAYEGVGY
jgi:hypothetical protein